MQYGEAINNAFERMKYLLWEKRSRKRWRNYAILSFLCGYGGGGGGGGGGDFSSLFKGSGHKHDTSMRVLLGCSVAGALGAQASDAFGQELAPYMGLIILLVLGVFGLGLAISFISNFARPILVENIVHDREEIMEPWSRLSQLGWSVFWWGFVFVLVSSLAIGALVGLPAVGIAAMGSGGNEGAYLMFIPLFFWALLVIIPCCFVQGYFQEIVIPLMYRQNCSAKEAWALFTPMFNAQKGKWILYMVIHFFIVLAGNIATQLAGLLVLLAVGLVLAIPTIAAFAAGGKVAGIVCLVVVGCIFIAACFVIGALFSMPVTVAARSFSMYILQQVAPEYGFLPLGGRPLTISPVTGMVEAPSGGVGLNPETGVPEQQTQPNLDWSEMPPTQE